MHSGVCSQEVNPLIESGETNVSALNNDTTTVPDDVPHEPADKSALLFCYNNHLVCQLCWQTDLCLRVSKVADAIEGHQFKDIFIYVHVKGPRTCKNPLEP